MNSTATAAQTGAAQPPTAPRLESIDLLRGLVMMLMALDHTRDFFHFGAMAGWDPLDLSKTSPALFLTRWITHFCAPVFIFLAGTGAYLYGAKGRSKRDLSWFLLTRGAWLVVLEGTFVKWCGWTFNFEIHAFWILVIFVIGISMIVLAALIHLPLPAVATFGLVLILGHNVLDGFTPEFFGRWSGWWQIIHAGEKFQPWPGFTVVAGYPLIPWIGVMPAGYAFGRLFQMEPAVRQRRILLLGLGAIALFLIQRGLNLYGNTTPWVRLDTPTKTFLSTLDCTKYPPSLSYLLMTLGPALVILALLDRRTPSLMRPALTFGRVPLFFYLLHLPLIHAMALVAHWFRVHDISWLYGDTSQVQAPPGAGFGLAVTYLTWATALLILYPVCRWFAALKQRRRDAWLSYL